MGIVRNSFNKYITQWLRYNVSSYAQNPDQTDRHIATRETIFFILGCKHFSRDNECERAIMSHYVRQGKTK